MSAISLCCGDAFAEMNPSAPADEIALPSSTDPPTVDHHRLNIGTNTTPGVTGQITSDQLQDIEPAVITNQWYGVNTTFHVWTKWDANNAPHHYWASTTDGTHFAGIQALPTPSDPATGLPYTRSSDPWLSENPYPASGVFPSRTYASGFAYDLDTNRADVNPDGTCPLTGGCFGYPQHSGLTVWWNDRSNPSCDPITGSWCMARINGADYPLGFDKPAIATSWDTTNGTLGYTYVAATVIHYDQTQQRSTGNGSITAGTGFHDIQIYRQTNNWQGFYYVSQPFSNVLVTSPILVVNPANTPNAPGTNAPGSYAGDIYLFWVDWNYHVIQMTRSTYTSQGSSWDPVKTLYSPTNAGVGSYTISNNANTVVVSAATVLMAQYNSLDNSIGVVWNNRETDARHMDTYFCRFDMVTQSWGQPRHVGQFAANDGYDQWNPAIDVGSDGTYLVTWYDKHPTVDFDINNEYYRVVAMRLHADGSAYDTNETIIDQQPQPACLLYLPAVGVTFNNPIGLRYMGEYQGLWEWNGTYNGSTTYIDYVNHYQDIYTPHVTTP